MGMVNREAPLEPAERPTELGRHIWQTCHEHEGEFREVFETEKRELAVRIEGCLVGRGAGRIAPILDLSGWDARMVERLDEDQKPIYVVRVKYTAPKHPAQADVKFDSTMDALRQGLDPAAGKLV